MTDTVILPAAVGHSVTIYGAIELSLSSWVVGLVHPGSGKLSRHQLGGGAVDRLLELVEQARRSAGCDRVVLCYEAGRDGFWLYRTLVARGLEVLVLDPASLPVDRRRRRAKTDGGDAGAGGDGARPGRAAGLLGGAGAHG